MSFSKGVHCTPALQCSFFFRRQCVSPPSQWFSPSTHRNSELLHARSVIMSFTRSRQYVIQTSPTYNYKDHTNKFIIEKLWVATKTKCQANIEQLIQSSIPRLKWLPHAEWPLCSLKCHFVPFFAEGGRRGWSGEIRRYIFVQNLFYIIKRKVLFCGKSLLLLSEIYNNFETARFKWNFRKKTLFFLTFEIQKK